MEVKMKARLCLVLFPLALSIVGLSLSLPVPVFAEIASLTVNFQTVSDSSGTLVKGTILCTPGHAIIVTGGITQFVVNKLATTTFNIFVDCNGTIQDWTAPLIGTNGVPLKPGRAAVSAFAVDFIDFTVGPPINQIVILKP
jgi:hypothetical protein